MKKAIVLFALLALPFSLLAQFSIKGNVIDSLTNEPLAGATVMVENTLKAVFTDYKGNYEIRNFKSGEYKIKVTFIGYSPLSQSIDVKDNSTLDLKLNRSNVMADEVVITATRASDKTPTTYTNISKEELNKNNLGRDMPYLLNQTPSVVVSSDAGTGIGYTGIRIRGSDPSRVNVTINGVPVNDAESQGVYWVDMPDLASSTDGIQIQRGIGTSSNGAGAFGGSINVQTNKLNPDAYAEVNSSAGSFNTFKNTVKVGTGLISNKFSFDARLSQITSDGYINRASADMRSYYLSGAHYGKKSILKLINFAGKELTYQAWNGVPEQRLNGDVDGMNKYIADNYLDAQDAQNLLNSNSRTYNQFTYKNQTDNYWQNNSQLHYSKEFSSKFNMNAALHYTGGKGYYEEYKKQAAFSKYNLPDAVVNNDTITNSDLIRRLWLDNIFYGVVYSFNYEASKRLNFALGGASNIYEGAHYGEIIWSQVATNYSLGQRYYRDDATKKDNSVYLKSIYQINTKLSAWADIQYRSVNYDFLGYNIKLENVQQSAALNFWNPKAGLTYDINSNNNVYASYSIGNKEPNRDDYTQSTPVSRPKAEQLKNTELGYKLNKKRFTFGATFYYMDYTNQLVLTGRVNDVGAYTRTNVAQSYREGVELESSVLITKWLKWAFNATFSQNKIKNFTEYLDNYDDGTQTVIDHKNSDIAFSPNTIAASTISIEPLKNLSFSFISKYVGDQYLDNTSDAHRKLDAFFVNNFRINYALKNKLFFKEIGFTALVNNVLDVKYQNNGYTYSYIYGAQTTTQNCYYPQAGRNFMVGLNLKF